MKEHLLLHILLLEDSGRLMWGGGQKVSLQAMEALSPHYSIHLSDSTTQSLFFQKAQRHCSNFIKILSYGPDVFQKTPIARLRRMLEIGSFPFLLAINFFIVAAYVKKNSLNKNNTLIYAPTKKGLLLAYMLKLALQFRYIYHSHLPTRRNSAEFRLLAPALKRAGKVICVSDYVKEGLALNNCVTIYNGIKRPGGVRARKLNPSRVIVASSSSLLKWKGVEYFMRAHTFLKHKEVSFHIYGTGSEYKALRQFESDKVSLKGFTKDLDTTLKKEVSIFVSPSIEPEAFSMSILEAFSFGLPVIATDLGGHSKIMKDHHLGYCVPLRDPQKIAEKIDFLIAHPELYQRISSNCLRCVRNFDLSLFRKKITALFKEF